MSGSHTCCHLNMAHSITSLLHCGTRRLLFRGSPRTLDGSGLEYARMGVTNGACALRAFLGYLVCVLSSGLASTWSYLGELRESMQDDREAADSADPPGTPRATRPLAKTEGIQTLAR